MNALLAEHRVKQYLKCHESDESGYNLLEHILSNFNKAVVFGGAVRDLALCDSNYKPADIDIVVDTEEEHLTSVFQNILYSNTKFGGLRLNYSSTHVDIWPLRKTWAISNGFVKGEKFEDLLKTTFFNIDASFYSLHEDKLYTTQHYFEYLENRILDINLEPNPNPIGMIRRILNFAINRHFALTPRLIEFTIRNFIGMNSNQVESYFLSKIISHFKKHPEKNFSFYCLEDSNDFDIDCKYAV